MSDLSATRTTPQRIVGRCFLNPVTDYLLIGGGLSLVVTIVVYYRDGQKDLVSAENLPYFILLSNFAHFAASTVRLYAKPQAYQSLPFLTMGFPAVMLVALTLCIAFAETLGPHVQTIYLTWSPYHYAAQAYGLAVMYSYRSGCLLGSTDKKLLWWVAMLPFFFTFFAGNNSGLDWIVGKQTLAIDYPAAETALTWLNEALKYCAFVAPPLLFIKIWRSASGPMPLIAMLAVVTNAIWWFALDALDAFVWATVFHGIQYMAIVMIFHVRDQMNRPTNRRGRLYHAAGFYVMCVALGYALFRVLPLAYGFAGFGSVESALLVIAAINIHHFIVDGYIWRLKKTDGNRRIVDSGTPSVETSG